ncbi:molecular chaperone [Polaromonas sp. UC242_47]|uniref:molecular chaperone n=1 Tax=Polaromonas sp. UC242_47 TaxID=3374626 RepID=UPI0037976952
MKLTPNMLNLALAPILRGPIAIILLASGILSGAPMPAQAGVFSVTPVRIYMTPRDRAVAVTITNEGDAEVVLQADLNAWSQKPDGTDEQVPTEDLILSPPILKLAPNARQVVRLALLKPADASRQLIYRMIIREVPEAAPARDKTMQMPIALALSMPVFITPPPAKREINCQAAPGAAQALNVTCTNSGTAYAQVREILVKRGTQTLAKFEGGTYILPGARQIMSAKGEQALSPGPAQLNVGFDDGRVQTFDLTLP